MSRKNEGGFSLLEMVIGITVGFVLLGALAILFMVAARTNAVVGGAIQNQNSTRTTVSILEKDVRPAAAIRVTSVANPVNPSAATYYSLLDIKTADGKCIRWSARPTSFTGTNYTNYVVKFKFQRQVNPTGPVVAATPETKLSFPKEMTFSGISNVFGSDSLGNTDGVGYAFLAGLEANRTFVSGSVYLTSTPKSSTPCW